MPLLTACFFPSAQFTPRFPCVPPPPPPPHWAPPPTSPQVMEVVQTLDAGRRNAFDPDEIEEEQRERERRNKINHEFSQFVKRVQEVWTEGKCGVTVVGRNRESSLLANNVHWVWKIV